MKKPIIRIISLILAVLSLMLAFPLSVFAKEEKTETETDGKLIGTHVSDSATGTMLYGTNILHDAQGRVNRIYHGYDYTSSSGITDGKVSYGYTYDALDRLSNYSISTPDLTDSTRTFTYDALQRVSQINSSYTGDTQTFTQTESFTYDGTGTAASGRVKTHKTTTGTTAAKSYTYTYDANGNITKIEQSGGGQSSVEYRYVYDDQNQLIREDNGAKKQTYVYTYDNAGNMTSRKTYALTEAGTTPSSPTGTRSYTYGNEAWGDQLTAVNGYSNTYDSMGNPLTYYNGHNSYTFTWEEGKYLASAARGSNTVTYTYNENGIRTSKTVNGVKHTYTLNGSQIVSEAWDNKLVVLIYDESGSPIGMQYRESTYAPGEFDCFFYEKNLQGDIVGIFNEAGTRVVWYTYDVWGTSSPVYLTGYAWVYNANPFRYRGYYYDADTYLYYLNSRYYDHRAGRFISADVSDVLTATPMALTDKNLYAYCDNNPVMRADGDGEFWNVLAGAVVGGAVGLVTSAIFEFTEEGFELEDFGQIFVSTAIGAAEGAAIALMPGAAMAIGAVSNAADSLINDAIEGGVSAKEMAINSIVSAALGTTASADFVKGGKLLNEAGSALGTKVQKGVHPTVKKAANKAMKKAKRTIGRSIAIGTVEGAAHGGIGKFTSWYTNQAINRAFGR